MELADCFLLATVPGFVQHQRCAEELESAVREGPFSRELILLKQASALPERERCTALRIGKQGLRKPLLPGRFSKGLPAQFGQRPQGCAFIHRGRIGFGLLPADRLAQEEAVQVSQSSDALCLCQAVGKMGRTADGQGEQGDIYFTRS